VRDDLPILGNLVTDFNVSQPPWAPWIPNPCPPNTTLVPTPKPGCNGQVKIPRNLGAS